MPVDKPRAERAIRDFLDALGQNPEAAELKDTPRRVVEAFSDELLSGYGIDLPRLLAEGSEPHTQGDAGIVVVDAISLATVCPHHLMPAVGSATVAYRPGARILGLGTVARLVQAFAGRLSLQEKIGENVVDALVKHGAHGAFCRLVLRHSCLGARGAGQPHATVTTTASGGHFTTAAGIAELSLALDGREPLGA